MVHAGAGGKATPVAGESFEGENARITAFKEAGGGGKTTYYSHAMKLNVGKRGVKPLDVSLKKKRKPKAKARAKPKLPKPKRNGGDGPKLRVVGG